MQRGASSSVFILLILGQLLLLCIIPDTDELAFRRGLFVLIFIYRNDVIRYYLLFFDRLFLVFLTIFC